MQKQRGIVNILCAAIFTEHAHSQQSTDIINVRHVHVISVRFRTGSFYGYCIMIGISLTRVFRISFCVLALIPYAVFSTQLPFFLVPSLF